MSWRRSPHHCPLQCYCCDVGLIGGIKRADASEDQSYVLSSDDESDDSANSAPKGCRKKKRHEVQKDLMAEMHALQGLINRRF